MKGSVKEYDTGFLLSGIYKRHYSKALYCKVWSFVADCLKKEDKILDLGCGPGQFANMLFDRGFKNYVGIDFSTVAIEMAQKRVPFFTFITDDLNNVNFRKYAGFKFVSTECFEHVENDLQLLEKLPKGSDILFSVPNYMAKYHVRKFPNQKFIKKYYRSVLNVNKITTFVVWKAGRIFVVEAKII